MTKIQVGYRLVSWSNLGQLRFDQDFTSWLSFDQHFTIGDLDLDQGMTKIWPIHWSKHHQKVHHQILAILTIL